MINAVALNDSALLEMIEMLSTADGGVLIRPLLCGMLQAARRLPRLAPLRMSAPRLARRSATALVIAHGVGSLK